MKAGMQTDGNPGTNQNADLVRYQVLAANRRHFDALFFGTVAFSWSFGLGLWTAIRLLHPGTPGAAFLAYGLVLIAGSFIAHRLLKRERSSFEAMNAAWRRVSGDQLRAPDTPVRHGAMSIVTVGQFAVGLSLLAAATLL